MSVSIRPAIANDLQQYTEMMQATYEDAYVDDSIGLTKECFSMDVFTSADTQGYLKSKLVNDDRQKSWLAIDNGKIVGGIVIVDNGLECELTGFYVLPEYQGQGIGKQLWELALNFSNNKNITLDIYTHNKKTIELYEHWGFVEDTSKPHFYRHWPEWPEGLQAESMYMIRVN